MEVVAGIASVTQLIRYAIELLNTASDFQHTIRNQPKHLEQRIYQLRRLESTICSLNRSTLLNTPNVQEHLVAINKIISALNLQLYEAKNKRRQGLVRTCLTACSRQREKEKFAEIFADLEREKGSLLLSLAQAHTDISDKAQFRLMESLFK